MPAEARAGLWKSHLTSVSKLKLPTQIRFCKVRNGEASPQVLVAGGATVVTAALNVRSGPGTNYGRIAAVNQGDVLTVAGQSNNCGWLLIFTPDGQPGWVSGNSQYTTLDGACTDIPEADGPAPGGQSGSGQSSGGQAAGGQGCYTFQNQLGAELNITFTRRGDGWNTTFQVAPKGENRQCFDPGSYTYTLDAPPPWGSTNGELTVSAGDNFAFPIHGE